MNKEELRLFEEFKNAYGIDQKESFLKYQYEFYNWLGFRSRSAKNYAELYEYLIVGPEPTPRIIAEFGKGRLDTVAPYMRDYSVETPVIISQRADTFPYSYELPVFKGSLESLENGRVVVNYDTFKPEFPTTEDCGEKVITTFMTQYPFNIEDLHPYFQLLNKGINGEKTVFIGAYGLNDEITKNDTIARIKWLYNEFQKSDKEVNYCEETMDGCYMTAVKAYTPVKIKRYLLQR